MTEGMEVGIIGAASALLGAIIGGLIPPFYQTIRDWFSQPVLEIDYEGGQYNLVEVTVPSGAGRAVKETYVSVRVQNTGRSAAKTCRVFLVDLQEVYPSGTKPTTFRDSTMLAWAGYRFEPRDIPPGIAFYCDVMKVSQAHSEWVFPLERLFANQGNINTFTGTYRLRVRATAENAAAANCVIDITYDGNYRSLKVVPRSAAQRQEMCVPDASEPPDEHIDGCYPCGGIVYRLSTRGFTQSKTDRTTNLLTVC